MLQNDKKNDMIALIIFGQIGLVLFIMSRIFYSSLNPIASILKVFSYSMPLTLVISYLFRQRILKLIGPTNKPKTFFFLTSLFILFYFGALLSTLNRVLDNSPAKKYEVLVIETDQVSTKHSLVHYARIYLPVNTSCCFIPEAAEDINISKEEYQAFKPGASKVSIEIKDGFLKMPWTVSKKFIR